MRFCLLVSLLLGSSLLLGEALADQSQRQQKQPFQKDNDYVFQYNAQICSGLIAPNDESAADPQQNAVTRIQAQAKITFNSDRHAQLRLQQIRVGQLNEQLEEPEKVQPMAIFEPKQIPEENRRQLELPCQFSYADGVIERVQFHAEDDSWSKNVKRAVLNMIQLNLKNNNAQGLRSGDGQEQGQSEEEEGEEQSRGQLSKLAGKTFNIPEITLEGVCQTTYAINRASQLEGTFNVTKTINFKQCSKIADIAYGFQTQQPQPQCAQCQMYWAKRQQKDGQQEQQQPGEQHPCAKCDPKEVKEQMLDRSTMLRYQLACPSGNCDSSSQKYALQRTELLSQYVHKQAKSQTGQYSSAMQTIVAATLQLRSAGPKNGDESVPNMSASKEESLMFSNQRETDVKRFYMFGDEEFSQASSSPFHQVPKVQQAEQALRKLAQTITGDKQKGIEVQAGIELQRLVELLRMCTEEELRKVEQNGIAAAQFSQEEKQKAMHIFTDCLAICGTRNCVQRLAEKIQKKEISQPKAVQALRTLTQVPAASDQIVKIVQRLCKQEDVHSQRPVKQSCWLTFGALVNELCQHKTQKGAQQYAYGSQSGFDKQEQCPLDKKQEYKETILDLYKSAASTYDKMLALSALGNAGIDIAVGDIEQIAKDQSEARLVRCKAIDALRRLRTQMPRKIQQILLPIFQNGREQPEVRAAAFAILLSTQPEHSVIDQIVFTVAKENNRQIQAFAYRQMKALANSKNPVEQEMVKHVRNALKLANVDEQQLRYSGKWQVPMYSEQHQEGLFIDFAQIVSPRSAVPAYFHAQIESYINDQFNAGQLRLFVAQQEAEDWYHQSTSGGKTRAEHRSSSDNGRQSLREIYSALGIKSRRSFSFNGVDQYQQQEGGQNNRQPFAMLCLRTGDVDQGFVAIEGNNGNLQEAISRLFAGQSSLANVFGQFPQQQKQVRGALVTNLNKQQAIIPTSAGLPLRLVVSNPVVATIEGQVQVKMGSDQLETPLGPQTQINVHVMASLVSIQKMECGLPFMASGVESIRSVEANVPLHSQLDANPTQGISLKVKLPRQKSTLFGAHSLPFTYTAQVDTKTQLVHEPRHVRAIHQPKLERMQHDVSGNCKFAEQFGIPLHIQGHYHWPAQPTNYQQFIQMLMATENVVHITYQPNEETPREAIFRIGGTQFQKTSGKMPQLQDFYSQRIDSAFDSQELDDMQMDTPNQRNQKLQNFLGNYQPAQQYKHSLKLSAQTVGGTKECKAQAEVAANCDAGLQTCNVQLEALRSAMGGESQKWTLNAEAQVVMPETAQSTEEMAQLEQQKNNKLQCKAKVEWGASQKQHIHIRLQGEQAAKKNGGGGGNRRQETQQEKHNRQRRQAFLNKFDLEAQFKLKPEAQNLFGRTLEMVKSAYFWNSQSQLIGGIAQRQAGGEQSGKIVATIVIDPITQKHANASIKTPTQLVRLQQIELPTQCRPFPLIRQPQKSTHSIGQFINRIHVQGRAECTVDGRNVNTFDNVDYNAPLLDSCYSVLAKDCSSDEPQFVVLMKAQSRNGGLKKVKIITPEREIECQPKSGQEQQILCKENGSPVQDDNAVVEFNNGQKSDVTVNVPGISVRFNGRKAWLKVSSLYKNSQCGLCGHYDDSEREEWRMGNNENTNDLAQFHRSYAFKGTKQGEQCSEQELNNFYEQHGNKIRQRSQYRQNEDEIDEGDEQEQDWKNEEQFNGQLRGEDDDGEEREEDGQWQQNGKKERTQTPVKKTKILEMNHQICFSQEPVKQCPKGSLPLYSSQQDEEEKEGGEESGKNVHFACFSRTSTEARHLLRQVNKGSGVVQLVKNRGTSMAEKVREPKKCIRNRY